MPDARYYLVRDDEGWMIKFEDEHYGPYASQDDALRLALDAASRPRIWLCFCIQALKARLMRLGPSFTSP